MQKSKLLAYALVLLALAHPSLVQPALGTLGVLLGLALAAAAWIGANVSLTLTIAAGAVLARAFPGTFGLSVRWTLRALLTSAASVAPKTA
ncbi:hypothetical protein OG345_41680 (plasmid) [Streptomyces sp. NBC_01220]|uniref:hypothetical protein n=1 Tax=Streptomyces sp. NBC_01220 TaxID=2903781 RepID=UPI00352C9B67|nr:hypothetical protein OG345_41680 [Streptomyces sp. NBC_01220]